MLLPCNIFYNYSGTPLKRTPLRPPLRAWHMEVSASGILSVGMVMCFWAVEHEEAALSDFSVAIQCCDLKAINARSLNPLQVGHNLTL